MRATGSAAIVLLALSASAADAEWIDTPDWYRRLEATARSLIRAPPSDREVIKPPGNIDPQMVLAPPPAAGRMRIITPPND